jgi:hypothetical protein
VLRKDRATRTPLKPRVNSGAPERSSNTDPTKAGGELRCSGKIEQHGRFMLLDLSGAPEFTLGFSGVHVARSFIFCTVFCRSLFFLFSFFNHCICLPFDSRLLITCFNHCICLPFDSRLLITCFNHCIACPLIHGF